MAALDPQITSDLAEEIYALVDKNGTLEDNIKYIKGVFLNNLVIDKSNLLTGTSGMGFIKARTAFGIAAFGVNAYAGHAFIVLRGTDLLGDALTDLNAGVSNSSVGWHVHDGFNQTFQSLKPDLDAFITQMNSQNVHSVHCIGHSLGGALANLVAEYIRTATLYHPYLYTFGAPRVGMGYFANSLTELLTPQKIFRLYHRTDIVPCVPCWPFIHAPSKQADMYDYFLPSPGISASGEWHSMAKYTHSVASKGWGDLRSQREELITDSKIEAWLKKETPIQFNLTNLRWLDRAIAYVVTKCANALGISLTVGFATGFTLMDKLAYILNKGIDLAKSLTSWVMRLIYKMMSFIGLKPIADKSEATQEFVKSVFIQVSEKVNGQVKTTLNQTFYGGQGF